MNSSLKELHLQKCYVTDWGCERLAEALEHNSSLKLLDLSWCANYCTVLYTYSYSYCTCTLQYTSTVRRTFIAVRSQQPDHTRRQ